MAGMVASLLTSFACLSTWRRPLGTVSGVILLGVSVYYLRVFLALA